MDGVFELLPERLLGRVARHFQEEEARVALGKEVIRRVVLVHDLKGIVSDVMLDETADGNASDLQDKVPPSEVGDGPGQASPAPDEAQEERALRRAQLLHHLPEPLHQRGRRVDA